MSEHTPGPWAHDAGEVSAPTRATVCLMDDPLDQDDLDEIEANARLIAAAPKLLAACKAILCAMSTDDHRQATWMIMKAVQEAEGKPA